MSIIPSLINPDGDLLVDFNKTITLKKHNNFIDLLLKGLNCLQLLKFI